MLYLLLAALLGIAAALLLRWAWRRWRAAYHRKRNAQIAAMRAAQAALHMDRMAARRDKNRS